MRVLVTGAAGFIGAFAARRLCALGHEVLALDNFSPYYDVKLKRDRKAALLDAHGVGFEELDLADAARVASVFTNGRFDRVLHLAAQPGVRYSITHPEVYVRDNLVAFANVIEAARKTGVGHFVYASSSSVYGGNRRLPFAESDPVDHPVSLYAATKKANELMAHSYSHVHRLPTTGLRFFTVYGPWGRPDMSPMLFAHAIMAGKPIDVFNGGDMARDFTYVDDIVEGTVRALDHVATSDAAYDALAPDGGTSDAPWRVYNIGNHQAVGLEDYITTLERVLGRKAERRYLPMQPGDVKATFAATERLAHAVGFAPSTPLEQGLDAFARWFLDYFGHSNKSA